MNKDHNIILSLVKSKSLETNHQLTSYKFILSSRFPQIGIILVDLKKY